MGNYCCCCSSRKVGCIQTNSDKLWPPTKKRRIVVVKRLTNRWLSSQKMLEEAVKNAKKIEEMAFDVVNQEYEAEPDGDASSALKLYAKECSKLTLETLKRAPSKLTLRRISFNNGRVFFSKKSFGFGTAHAAKPILSYIQNESKTVDLVDFIAGKPLKEAPEVMDLISTAVEASVLSSIDLSNNALSEMEFRAFVAFLKSQRSSLERLYLMSDSISEEAALAVCEFVPLAKKLRVFHFRNNVMGVEGALAIAEVVKNSPLLKDFRYSSTRVGSKGLVALSEALDRCAYLEKLDLRDNMFGVEAGVTLGKALSKHANLIELNLSFMNLEDLGVISLANALKDSVPCLRVLELAGNDITQTAAPALADCLSGKKHLSKLNLSKNKLNDEGVIHVSKSLAGLTKLKELDVSGNAISWVSARVLAQMVVNKPLFKLIKVYRNFVKSSEVGHWIERA